jgi:hypothetical protein
MTINSPSSAPATTPQGLVLGYPAVLTDEPARTLKEVEPKKLGGSLLPDTAPRCPCNLGYYGEMVWIMMVMGQWLRTHTPAFKPSRD